MASIQTGLTLGKHYSEECSLYPYLRVANVQDGRIDIEDIATIDIPEALASHHLLHQGDVLMTEANGNPDKIGRGAVWHAELQPCLHQNHVFALRSDLSSLKPEYLALCMGSAWGRAYFRATSTQVGIASTNASKIRRFPIPLPPIEEQERMLAVLEERFAHLDKIESEIRTQLQLLSEHRQALITIAVTGQLDPTRSAA